MVAAIVWTLLGVSWCLILAPNAVRLSPLLAEDSSLKTSPGWEEFLKSSTKLGRLNDEENLSLDELEHRYDEENQQRNAVYSQKQLWPNRKIAYQISDEFTPELVENIDLALRYFGDHTCMSFEEYDEQRHSGQSYVSFQKSETSCGTLVGYQGGRGPHKVNLHPFCANRTDIVQHETLHVLGLNHEHRRPDRDNYVRIEYFNIPLRYWIQFPKLSEREVSTYGVPYDFGSIMHYNKNAFAIDPKKPTIVAKDGVEREMGNKKEPTEADLTKIRLMYKC